MARGFFTKDEWYAYFDWNPEPNSKREVPDAFIERFSKAKRELEECLKIIKENYVG